MSMALTLTIDLQLNESAKDMLRFGIPTIVVKITGVEQGYPDPIMRGLLGDSPMIDIGAMAEATRAFSELTNTITGALKGYLERNKDVRLSRSGTPVTVRVTDPLVPLPKGANESSALSESGS